LKMTRFPKLDTNEFQDAFKQEAGVIIQDWMEAKHWRLKVLLIPGIVPKPGRNKIYERYLVVDGMGLKIFVQRWPGSEDRNAPHQRPQKTFERLAALIPLTGTMVRERYRIRPLAESGGLWSWAKHRDRVELVKLRTQRLRKNRVNWISDSPDEGYDLRNLSEKDVIMIKVSIDRLDAVSTFVPEEYRDTYSVKRQPTDDSRVSLQTQLESHIQRKVSLKELTDVLTKPMTAFPEIYTSNGKILVNYADTLKYMKEQAPTIYQTYSGSYYLKSDTHTKTTDPAGFRSRKAGRNDKPYSRAS